MNQLNTARIDPFSAESSLPERLSTWLKEPFPFYLNDDRKNAVLVMVVSLFVTGFLYLFRTPNEFIPMNNAQWIHGTITLFVLLFNVLALPRLFPVMMDPVSWNYKKYILLNIWHLVLISAITIVIEKVFICKMMSWTEVALHVNTMVALKGIIPIALTTLFLKAHLLQQNLHEAIRSNRELQKIQTLKKGVESVHSITLFSDTSESLTFNLPDLLFVEADDNYSTVWWRESGEVRKKLLRVNLKNIESQLDNSFALRCHRSYVVNVNAIEAISGNTNGYKLRIRGTDFSIPVSRPKGKEVMEKISQLRNLMELS